MIPKASETIREFTFVTYPGTTYKLDFDKKTINGHTDGKDALRQAIRKILSTERYDSIIYSWNYGIELKDLIGRPKSYVLAELPRRITEALMQDDRVKEVSGFSFETEGNKVAVTFSVRTTEGDIGERLVVSHI